jgi:hypothetical protein
MDYRTFVTSKRLIVLRKTWMTKFMFSEPDNPCQGLEAWWHKLHQNIIKGIAISIVVWHYYYVEQWYPLGFKCIVPQVLQIKRLVLWMWYWDYYDNYLKWPKKIILPNMATFWTFTIFKKYLDLKNPNIPIRWANLGLHQIHHSKDSLLKSNCQGQ